MIIEGEHGGALQDLIQAALAAGKAGLSCTGGCAGPLFSHHQALSSRLLFIAPAPLRLGPVAISALPGGTPVRF